MLCAAHLARADPDRSAEGLTRPPAEGLTDDAWKTVLAGGVGTVSEAPTDASRGRARGFVIVKRPWEDVWATVQDHEHFPEFMPKVERIAVLAFEPDKGFKRVTEWVNVVFSTYEYTLDFKLDRAARRIEYRLNKSFKHDLEEVIGGWFMYPLSDGRTLLAYTSFVDSGVAIPRFVTELLQGTTTRDLMESVRRRVESGGKWKR